MKALYLTPAVLALCAATAHAQLAVHATATLVSPPDTYTFHRYAPYTPQYNVPYESNNKVWVTGCTLKALRVDWSMLLDDGLAVDQSVQNVPIDANGTWNRPAHLTGNRPKGDGSYTANAFSDLTVGTLNAHQENTHSFSVTYP